MHHEKVVLEDDDHDSRGFTRGPENTSLLTSYVDHVAHAISDGQFSIVL